MSEKVDDDELSPELKRVFRLILITGMTLFSLVAIEVGVVILEGAGAIPTRILPEQKLNYKVDIYARHRFEPDTRNARVSDGREFPINALGMRGPETTIEKKPGKVRILVYGGSHVFDQNVSGYDDWPRVVERKLHDAGLDTIEVLNLGVPGHSTTDAVGRLLTEGHRFEPDFVLLDYGWNDLKYFASDALLNRQQRPFVESYRTQYYNGLDRFLCRMSRFYLGGRWAFHSLKGRMALLGSVAGSEGAYEEREPVSSLTPHGPRQLELNVRAFVGIAKSIGAQPVLVKQPTLVSRSNTAEEKAMIHYQYVNMDHETLCDANDQVSLIFDTVARETGTPVIDVKGVVKPSPENFTDAVHATSAGSLRIADAVVTGLLPLISPNQVVDGEDASAAEPTEQPPAELNTP